ncbi:MAG: hypothetical protein JSR18_04440 [Proteobacteria bacterium]|nr:hypothetical protein [Pseudomonadota bacterium]
MQIGWAVVAAALVVMARPAWAEAAPDAPAPVSPATSIAPAPLYRVAAQPLPAAPVKGGERGRAPYAPEALDDDETDSDPGLPSVVFDHDGAYRIEEANALRFATTINVYGKQDAPPPKIKPFARRFGDTTPPSRSFLQNGPDYGASAKPCMAFPSQFSSGLGSQFNFYGYCP